MNDRWQMLYPSAFLVTFHAKYVPCYAASVLFCIQRRANQMKRARIITAVDYLKLEALKEQCFLLWLHVITINLLNNVSHRLLYTLVDPLCRFLAHDRTGRRLLLLSLGLFTIGCPGIIRGVIWHPTNLGCMPGAPLSVCLRRAPWGVLRANLLLDKYILGRFVFHML